MAERRDNKKRKLNKGEYQKADGRYMYRYTDINGKPRFVYSWTLTSSDRTPEGKQKGECLRKLEADIAKDLADGIDSYSAGKRTVSDCIEDYLTVKAGLKQNSREIYLYIYRSFIRDRIGRMNISEVKYSDIKRFYTELLINDELGGGTIELINSVLSPVFTTAIRDGVIRNNPVRGVIREMHSHPKWSRREVHALTVPQQETLMRFALNSPVYSKRLNLLTVMLGTGMRVGETLALTWDDCDFTAGIITVRGTMSAKKDPSTGVFACRITTPKSKHGCRIIPMIPDVRNALISEKIRQERAGLPQRTIDGRTNFVFTGRNGGVMYQSDVDRILKTMAAKSNEQELQAAEAEGRQPVIIPKISAHVLRHTFCTRLAESGTPIKVIQEVMGHSNILLTMNIYAEATADSKTESFSNLNNILCLA